MNTNLNIGTNALDGTPVSLSLSQILAHWAIIGGTGRGKSKLMELVARLLLHLRLGFIILDPGGTLYENVLKYAKRVGFSDRVVSIDVNDLTSSFGLDLCVRDMVDEVTLADQTTKAFVKAMGHDGSTAMPLMERWMRNTLMPLIECPSATFGDMLTFLSSEAYRTAVLCYCSNEHVKREWQSFDSLKRSEREQILMSVHNRAVRINVPNTIRRMIGQRDTPFNIESAVEGRKAVLVNLCPISTSREVTNWLGINIVDRIVNYAFARTEAQRRIPFMAFVDECDELGSPDLPFALAKLRKTSIYFALAFQSLSQLEGVAGFRESVMTNTDVKCTFKTSRADAEKLVGELFAGRVTGDIVKDEIFHTIQVPHETTREVTVDTEGRSRSSSSASGSSASSGRAEVDGRAFSGPLGVGVDDIVTASIAGAKSDSVSWSDVESESVGESTARSTSVVPFYEYLRESELSSRQYYSLDEIREKFISYIQCQPGRHLQLKVGDADAIPLITRYVKAPRVRAHDFRAVIEQSNRKYALPPATVDRMIMERREKLLGHVSQEVENEEVSMQESRWQ